MIQGAFMIGTVGTVADGTDLAAALGRAIELTPTLPFEQQGYPRPRGAVQELLRAADVLVTRGFASPDRNTTGSIAMWLVGIGHGARPAGWVEDMLPLLSHRIMFVRELALDRMPAEVPASLVNAVGANLDPSVDLDVRIAACRVVDRGRLAALRADVVRTLQTADEFWLRNAAGNALHALGAVYESLVLQASRIAEPALSAEILGSLLLGVLDATGLSSGPVAPEEARALAERWRVFVAAHRGNIEAHRKIPLDDPSVSADLVPRGWTLHRENKPGWPPR
jgi:hypothetical protein